MLFYRGCEGLNCYFIEIVRNQSDALKRWLEVKHKMILSN